MQASAARQSRPSVVAALRAAGCVFAEDEARLLIDAAGSSDELTAMVARRVAGHPLEHVLGWAQFCGLRIVVEPGVFVPRRRSEFLVREAVALARTGSGAADRPIVLVDLCCGSGAVGAALVAELGRVGRGVGSGPGSVELYAVDIDPAAVRCARRNVPTGGRVYQGDLYAPLPAGVRGQVDLLVANAPYVPTEAVAFLPPEARDYEPKVALDGGADGLDIVRRVAAGAPEWLAPGGHLLLETSERQAPVVVATYAGHGLAARAVSSREWGATLVSGTRN